VIVAGSKESVARALKQAEGYRKQLVERGVVVVPLVLGEDWKAEAEAAAAKRKGFGGQAKAVRLPAADAASETLVSSGILFCHFSVTVTIPAL